MMDDDKDNGTRVSEISRRWPSGLREVGLARSHFGTAINNSNNDE